MVNKGKNASHGRAGSSSRAAWAILQDSSICSQSAHTQPPPPEFGDWATAGPGTSRQDVSRTKSPSIPGPLLLSLACHPTLCVSL